MTRMGESTVDTRMGDREAGEVNIIEKYSYIHCQFFPGGVVYGSVVCTPPTSRMCIFYKTILIS